MTFRFNQLLAAAGIDPAGTRLLRHQEQLLGDTSPFDLWHADRAAFERYQAHQLFAWRSYFQAQYWASFAVLRDGRTVFVGLYALQPPARLETAYCYEANGKTYGAGEIDFYDPKHSPLLQSWEGRLFVEWGGGSRSWRQRADNQNKLVSEIYAKGHDVPFPGLMALCAPASNILTAPPSWREHLAAAKGVYLLTCPRTGEVYVGSATGSSGFWGRWLDYEAEGHGGNVALKLRERTDWLVSILQVASSTDTRDDIVAAEHLWMRKLQSRELGLNRN